MKQHNPDNERAKRKYLAFLKEAKRQSESSIDMVAKSLKRFEVYTSFRDFKSFHVEQAIGFKKHLAGQLNQCTGEQMSKSTMSITLRHLKNFFQWLCMQAGYKSKVSFTDAEYFNLSDKDMRIATAKRARPVPTVEQIRHVLGVMPQEADIDRRNRALIAFVLLTGARDGAVASMKLKHIDLSSESVYQDAREVNTKFSKSFTTYFFPVGDDIRNIVVEWVSYLREVLLFGNNDPLFPKTKIVRNAELTFESSGLTCEHWANAAPIRTIFKEAFQAAGLQYFNPHSFRKTLVHLGEKICQTPEDFKSWSQNLGHEAVMTTFYSYGEVQPQRQAEIFQQLKNPQLKVPRDTNDFAMAVVDEIMRRRV